MSDNDKNPSTPPPRITLEDPYCACAYPVPDADAFCCGCARMVWLEACAADWNASREASQ